MDLGSLLKRYLVEPGGGVLSLKLRDVKHLLKIYIENGEIVYITLGTLKNDQCLEKLKDISIEEYFFLKGVKAPSKSDTPLTQSLLEICGAGEVEMAPKSGAMVPPSEVQMLEADFVEIIGPIGKIIIDDIFSKMAYTRGSPMPESDYRKLFDSIIKELPSTEQVRLRSKYKM